MHYKVILLPHPEAPKIPVIPESLSVSKATFKVISLNFFLISTFRLMAHSYENFFLPVAATFMPATMRRDMATIMITYFPAPSMSPAATSE